MPFASASLDGKIMVWELSPLQLPKSSLGYFRIAKTVFSSNGIEFCVHRKGVLRGQNDGVSSVCFFEPVDYFRSGLLSASLDGSVQIWVYYSEKSTESDKIGKTIEKNITETEYLTEKTGQDPKNTAKTIEWIGGGEWDETQIVCKSREKRSGFTRAVWSGRTLAASGKNGAVRSWGFCEEKDAFTERASATGHVGKVTAAKWNQALGVLFTAGWDRTVRVWMKAGTIRGSGRWVEVGRPQTHGYKIENLCFLKSDPFSYISFSQEEAIRIFTATKAFTSHFPSFADSAQNRAERAVYSDLNLCNAPASTATNSNIGDNNYFSGEKNAKNAILSDKNDFSIDNSSFLTDSFLATETLWQEVHKLYVRRNKITAVALSERTLAVASESCTTSKKCEIEFWAVGPEIKLEENSENGVEFIENRENKEKQEEISRKWEKLKGSVVCHSLAVTDMAFSPDGQFLVSASRDKSVGVFGVAKDKSTKTFETLKTIKNAHSRSINCCRWSGASTFLTGSSDKSLKLWAVNSQKTTQNKSKCSSKNGVSAEADVSLLAAHKFSSGISCISLCRGLDTVSVGMADGAVAQIEMIKGGEAFGAESVLTKMAGAVTALDWGHFGDDGGALLAVADDNGVVKILEFMLG